MLTLLLALAPLRAGALGGAGPPGGGEGWRTLGLEGALREDLQERIDRGFRSVFGEVLTVLEVAAREPSVRTDGDTYCVAIPELEVRFRGMDGWDGDIQGVFEAEDLWVDYGKLGVGEVEYEAASSFDAVLHADVPSLTGYLEGKYFEDARFRFPEDRIRSILEGRLEVGILFFDWHPEVRVEGYFARDGERFVFEPTEVRVRGAPGFVRARIRETMREKAGEAFGLDRAMRLLQDRGVELGTVHLTHTRDGEVVFAQNVRGVEEAVVSEPPEDLPESPGELRAPERDGSSSGSTGPRRPR